ncbi:MAG: adaptor protein MecA [Clostridia bacterium]|nr:adaptor protein MecA [Clostridia bacterium]
MELIVINQEKLKIILTPNDMTKYNITPEELDYNKVTTKHILWDLLEKAQKEKGFDTDMSKLYVQIYPSRDGGCEMYITKFSGKSSQCINNNLYFKEKNRHQDDCFIYLNYNDLYKLCKRITSEKIKLDTKLYYNSEDLYVLVLCQKKRLPHYISEEPKKYTIPNYLSEYGVVHAFTEKAQYYMDEHFKKLSDKNAVELLSSI